ncbi:toprim domain-containing protein [Niabella terrae]
MARKRMSAAAVNELDLVEFLQTQGFEPARIRGTEYWYYSPFHEERTPSFKIDRRLNAWYDHSIGQGGYLIDFGKQYFNCSFKELMEKLADNYLSVDFRFSAPAVKVKEKKPAPVSRIKILGIGIIKDAGLKAYFKKRKISLATARRYCKQIEIETPVRSYPVIGFPNCSDGYELRSTGTFKGTVKPKDFSLIRTRGAAAMVVVEGFFDFLSLVESQSSFLEEPVQYLILNSVVYFKKALPLLLQQQRVYLMLDNDAAGRRCKERLQPWPDHFVDLSDRFLPYKDLSEWLMHTGTEPISRETRGKT